MKKTLSFLMIVSLCLSLLMLVTSCSSMLPFEEPDQHPIEAFVEKMEKAGSYQTLLTEVIDGEVISLTIQTDGNIHYGPASEFNPETYCEIVGDVAYIYIKDGSEWEKEKVENIDSLPWSITCERMILKLFENLDHYEKVTNEENVYKLKDDIDLVFDYEQDERYDPKVTTVKITIADDSCTIDVSIDASIDSPIGTVDITMVISKIGEIELTLPNVG